MQDVNGIRQNRRQVFGWCMYDWANSTFATTVMAGFFPVLFKQFWSIGVDVNFSTFILGLTNSLTGLIVAISAPILGAIADRGSSKKRFLIFFAYLGVLMTSLLMLLEKGQWVAASVFYGIGVIGFSAGNSFYDSLLPMVAGEKKIDYVSGLGYSLGYLGGGILFLVNVLMTQKPAWFGLESATEGVRYSFLTVGIWWGLFTIPLILWVREEKKPIAKGSNTIFSGFREVAGTFRKVRMLRETFIFLVGYWFYIDGVDTIIRMAVDFGMSIGFSSMDLILALLITQFVGFPSAIIYARLGEKWGVKKLIFIGVAVYLLVTLFGMMMTRRFEFYVLAIAIGLVQGGVQALSRSFYSRLIPPEHEAEFYGLYNMLGKFAAIIGPALMGIVGLMVVKTGFSQNIASRAGIGSIVILFILGGFFLYKVDEKKGLLDARSLVE
jgi:MFS transporter, UMF1 family